MATALRVSRRKTPNPSNTLDIIIILPYIERTYIGLEYDKAEDIRIKTGDLAMNVRTLCLGILNFEEATGYEIKKLSVEGRFSHFIDASFGSIYPALTRLCDEGLVNVRVEQQEGKPARKVYSITDAGRAEFIASLNEAPAPDKIKSEFLFLMLCSEFMNTEQVEKAIDDRIAWLDQEIEKMNEFRHDCDHTGSQFAIGYGTALYKAARDYLKANRAVAIANANNAQMPREAELTL